MMAVVQSIAAKELERNMQTPGAAFGWQSAAASGKRSEV
jgi:hypothetical protein